MNNLQILQLMNEFQHRNRFKGVFAANKLPSYSLEKKKTFSYIANTDNYGESGEHWVGFYFPLKGKPEYFDSYGLPPLNDEFFVFMGKNSYLYNNITLQAPMSNTCGYYCIYYLCERMKGLNPYTIISVFDENRPYFNDMFVKNYIHHVFDTDIELYDFNFDGHQISKLFQPQNYKITRPIYNIKNTS